MESGPERRKNIRIPTEGDDVKVYYQHNEHSPCGKAVNISLKGMQIECPFTFPQHANISLTLAGRSIKTSCEVVHGKRSTSVDGPGVVGLRFEFDNIFHMKKIEDFIRLRKEANILISPQIEESRRYPRIRYLIAPEIKEGNIIKSSIRDISAEGLFLRYEGNLSLDSNILINFTLPGRKGSISAKGNVIYLAEGKDSDGNIRKGAGISFTEVMLADKRKIHNFVLEKTSAESFGKLHKSFEDHTRRGKFLIKTKNETVKVLRDAIKEKIPLNILLAEKLLYHKDGISELNENKGLFCIKLRSLKKSLASRKKDKGFFALNFPRWTYYFVSTAKVAGDKLLYFSIPREISYSERRSSRRRISNVSELVTIEIVTAQGGPLKSFIGEIVEVSDKGFSLRFPQVKDFEKSIFDNANVRVPGKLAGKVKSILLQKDAAGSVFIRLGAEAGVQRESYGFRSISLSDWEQDQLFQNAGKTESFEDNHDLKKIISETHYYNNSKKQHIAAIIDMSRRGVRAPVVIIPPAFGKKKEHFCPLSMTLMESFVSRGKDIVVVRYDGINCPGQSFIEERYRQEGREMIDFTIGQSLNDLEATLEFVNNNRYFTPEKIIVVSFCMTAISTRALSASNSHGVDYWISLMGITEGQMALRSISGGLDIIGSYNMGLRNGVLPILGHMIDCDNLARDAVDNGFAFISQARKEMGKIKIPTTWVYGSMDDWVRPEDVKDLMSVKSSAPREIIEVPCGHNLRTGEDAFRCYRIISHLAYKYLFREDIVPCNPSMELLLEFASKERERLEVKLDVDLHEYWKKYLMGSSINIYGYDFLKNIEEFIDLLEFQENLLGLRPGDIFGDMGCGTGIFMEILLNKLNSQKNHNFAKSKLVLVDFIQEALDKCEEKYKEMLKDATIPLPAVEFIRGSLEVSRLAPIKRYISGEYGIKELSGKIVGLRRSLLGTLDECMTENLENYLKGLSLSFDMTRSIKNKLSNENLEVISELNRASRYVNRTIIPDDFKSRVQAWKRQVAEEDYQYFDASDLRFHKLYFGASSLAMELPFPSSTFDKLLASLVIPYVYNPSETVREFYRLLKPGGKILVSSNRPDPDMSRMFMSYVNKVASSHPADSKVVEGIEHSLEGARGMLNEAARIFELEENGMFTFYSRKELEEMLNEAGFKEVKIHSGFGNPPQAYIAFGYK